MSQPPPDEDRRHRRGLRFRKREDYAIELFRQAQASLGDVAQVDRLLLQLGRFYNPYVNAPIVDLETRKRIVTMLGRGMRRAPGGSSTSGSLSMRASTMPGTAKFHRATTRKGGSRAVALRVDDVDERRLLGP